LIRHADNVYLLKWGQIEETITFKDNNHRNEFLFSTEKIAKKINESAHTASTIYGED
jgi:hypothetical protein